MLSLRHCRLTAVGWLVGAVILTASGCSGAQPTSDPADVQPRQSSAQPPPSADWNLTDATYLTMMIPHHRQALDLADLAETRAADPRVLAIARSIDRGQSREILVMATWLVDHDLPEPTLEDVAAMNEMAGSPAGMVGMLSPEEMTALAAMQGAEFDRLFLTGMIQHHRGAIEMADDQLGGGEDVRVTEMATDVVATQNGEIRRMEDLLADLT